MGGAVCWSMLAVACGGDGKKASAGVTVRGSGGATDSGRVTQANARGESAGAIGRATATRPRLLFVGTSLTAGYGLEPEQAYPVLISQRIDSLGLAFEVVNAGVSGATSADTRRQVRWLVRQPVDVFVLETGANDGLRGLSVDSMRANLRAILDTVRLIHPRARLFLMQMEAPPNLGSRYTSDFEATFPAVAKESGATLIPFLLAGVAGQDALNQQDGIHPNERGERMVADNVWRALRPTLDPKGATR